MILTPNEVALTQQSEKELKAKLKEYAEVINKALIAHYKKGTSLKPNLTIIDKQHQVELTKICHQNGWDMNFDSQGKPCITELVPVHIQGNSNA